MTATMMSCTTLGVGSLLGDYRPTVSPFPPAQVQPAFSTEHLLLAGLLLALLVAVGIHGRRAGRFNAAAMEAPLPALPPWEWMLLIGLTAGASVAFLVPSYLRYARYGIGSFDIGIYTHAFWNALHGQGFFNSPEGMDHLSGHASPGLYLLLPVYALAPHPFTLLALNGLALTSGAIPAHLIARRRLGAAASLCCAAVYLVNPALRSLNYDVHEITFAVPLLLWTMLFLQSRRAGPMLATLSLALLFKEDVGFTACALGIYVAGFQRRLHLGAALILLGLLWVVVGIYVIVPYFGGSHANMLMSHFGALGDDWIEVLLSPLRRPRAFAAVVFSGATGQYLLRLLAPFAFLPLLAPKELVLAVPPLTVNVLSSHAVMRSGEFHYDALILPAFYLAFVVGVTRLFAIGLDRAGAARWGAWPGRLQSLVLAGLVLASLFLHRSVGRAFLLDIDGDPARAELDTIVRLVPPDVPVVSPQHVQPHLSNRTVSAYLNNVDDFTRDHPPFHYAVLPLVANPPPPQYEAAWRGTSYVLFRLRAPPITDEPSAGQRPPRETLAPSTGERVTHPSQPGADQ